MSPRSNEDIIALAAQRKEAAGSRHAKMLELAEVYNGDVVLPLPELDTNEAAAIANVLQVGVDGNAQRAASTMPVPTFPSLRPGFDKHDQDARNRRKATLGWWARNSMDLLLGRRFRHLITYASSPNLIRPSTGKNGVPPGIPEWNPRVPLGAYPAPSVRAENLVPSDAIFCYAQTARWVKGAYPEALNFIRPPRRGESRDDERVELIEYVDDEVLVLLAVGETSNGFDAAAEDYHYGPPLIWNVNGRSANWARQLERSPNKARRPLATFPGRITLSGPVGQFDSLPGMHFKQAKLDALEYLAIEDGVFPRLWLVSNPNETARIVAAPRPRQGLPGLVEGGDLKNLNQQPSYMANQAMDRLERNQRVDGHVPSQMGGEAPTNVRTGRANDSVLGASIDYGIAEAQKVMAASLAAENEIAIAVARGHFGSRPQTWAVSWAAPDRADYTAASLFPPGSEYNEVKYSMAGADVNALTIRAGQLVGVGLASKELVRELHPDIPDAEREKDRIMVEGIMDALLSSIQAQAADPTGPYQPEDLAFIAMELDTGRMELPEAILAAQKRAQERQASLAPPTPPGMAAPPETMPGLSPPGVGAEVPAAIPEVEPSQAHLGQLLNSLGSSDRAMRRGRTPQVA